MNGRGEELVALPDALRARQAAFDRAFANLVRRITPARTHRCRIGGRRLVALLRGLEPMLSDHAIRSTIRRVANVVAALGEAREADVRLMLLAPDFPPAASAGRSGINLVAIARAERDGAYERLKRGLHSARVRRRRARITAAVTSLIADPALRAVPISRLRKHIHRRVRRLLARASQDPLSRSQQHRLRLRVKDVRYLAEDIIPDPSAKWAARLQKLGRVQRILGDSRDREDLDRWVAAHGGA